MRQIRCKWFEADGRPIRGGCRNENSCLFIHPGSSQWNQARPPDARSFDRSHAPRHSFNAAGGDNRPSGSAIPRNPDRGWPKAPANNDGWTMPPPNETVPSWNDVPNDNGKGDKDVLSGGTSTPPLIWGARASPTVSAPTVSKLPPQRNVQEPLKGPHERSISAGTSIAPSSNPPPINLSTRPTLSNISTSIAAPTRPPRPVAQHTVTPKVSDAMQQPTTPFTSVPDSFTPHQHWVRASERVYRWQLKTFQIRHKREEWHKMVAQKTCYANLPKGKAKEILDRIARGFEEKLVEAKKALHSAQQTLATVEEKARIGAPLTESQLEAETRKMEVWMKDNMQDILDLTGPSHPPPDKSSPRKRKRGEEPTPTPQIPDELEARPWTNEDLTSRIEQSMHILQELEQEFLESQWRPTDEIIRSAIEKAFQEQPKEAKEGELPNPTAEFDSRLTDLGTRSREIGSRLVAQTVDVVRLETENTQQEQIIAETREKHAVWERELDEADAQMDRLEEDARKAAARRQESSRLIQMFHENLDKPPAPVPDIAALIPLLDDAVRTQLQPQVQRAIDAIRAAIANCVDNCNANYKKRVYQEMRGVFVITDAVARWAAEKLEGKRAAMAMAAPTVTSSTVAV